MWPPVTRQQEALAEQGRQRVLAGDPYLDEPGLMERFGDWLARRFGNLSPDAQTADSWFSGVGRFLDAAAPWLLAGLALLALWWMWRNRGSVKAGSRSRGGGARVDHHAAERSAGAWLDECDRLAGQGQYPAAVRAAYRAIVVHLVERDHVPSTPGLTVGAHRGLVAHSDVLDALQAEGFDQASDVFERVWYAPQQVDRDPTGDGAGVTASVTVRPATAADVEAVVAAATRLGVRR